jgi:hypothetical protein
MMQTGQSGCLDLTDPLQRLLVRGLRWIYERMPGQNETEAGTMQEDDFMTQLKKMRAAFLKAQRQQKVRDKKKQVLESTGGTDADGTETLPARSGWVGTPCSECHTVCPAQYHCNASAAVFAKKALAGPAQNIYFQPKEADWAYGKYDTQTFIHNLYSWHGYAQNSCQQALQMRAQLNATMQTRLLENTISAIFVRIAMDAMYAGSQVSIRDSSKLQAATKTIVEVEDLKYHGTLHDARRMIGAILTLVELISARVHWCGNILTIAKSKPAQSDTISATGSSITTLQLERQQLSRWVNGFGVYHNPSVTKPRSPLIAAIDKCRAAFHDQPVCFTYCDSAGSWIGCTAQKFYATVKEEAWSAVFVCAEPTCTASFALCAGPLDILATVVVTSSRNFVQRRFQVNCLEVLPLMLALNVLVRTRDHPNWAIVSNTNWETLQNSESSAVRHVLAHCTATPLAFDNLHYVTSALVARVETETQKLVCDILRENQQTAAFVVPCRLGLSRGRGTIEAAVAGRLFKRAVDRCDKDWWIDTDARRAAKQHLMDAMLEMARMSSSSGGKITFSTPLAWYAQSILGTIICCLPSTADTAEEKEADRCGFPCKDRTTACDAHATLCPTSPFLAREDDGVNFVAHNYATGMVMRNFQTCPSFAIHSRLRYVTQPDSSPCTVETICIASVHLCVTGRDGITRDLVVASDSTGPTVADDAWVTLQIANASEAKTLPGVGCKRARSDTTEQSETDHRNLKVAGAVGQYRTNEHVLTCQTVVFRGMVGTDKVSLSFGEDVEALLWPPSNPEREHAATRCSIDHSERMTRLHNWFNIQGDETQSASCLVATTATLLRVTGISMSDKVTKNGSPVTIHNVFQLMP